MIRRLGVNNMFNATVRIVTNECRLVWFRGTPFKNIVTFECVPGTGELAQRRSDKREDLTRNLPMPPSSERRGTVLGYAYDELSDRGSLPDGEGAYRIILMPSNS